MEQTGIQQTVNQLRAWMTTTGYSKGTLLQFESTVNQLLNFMDSTGTSEYTTDVGMQFLRERYAFCPENPSEKSAERLRCLQRLSEIQLHGTAVLRGKRKGYHIPPALQEATAAFLARRRFEGITERNMGTVSLYLERFFNFLDTRSVAEIRQITGDQVQDYLKLLAGYSNQSKDHMMRTVRQFLKFCFQSGYHFEDLSPYAPNVHYEKRARIPCAYSYDDVTKLLSLVDRSNPIGKRNYAILLLIARLGLRSGDVANLKYENIDWENNRISLTQHKTGRPLALPLLEDVGLAVIDYLKFGRPKCDKAHIFVRHHPPVGPFQSGCIYGLVASYIGKAGLLTPGKKRGPHALRHSLASRLLEENVPLPVISEILGHANTNTTAVYLSIDVKKLRTCALEV